MESVAAALLAADPAAAAEAETEAADVPSSSADLVLLGCLR